MHELLLFAQVPPSRHNYVLNVLTGLAAMQPQHILEKHLIFKPARLPAAARPAHVGAFQGVQNSQLQALQGQTSGDLYYLQLVGDIGARGSGRRGLREGEEGVIDVLMGEGNGDVQLEGKVRCRSLISLSPLLISWLKVTQKEDTAPATPATNETADNIQSWTLQFRDLPEPVARRPVTSRLMADIPITLGDPLQLMSALDYQ